MIPDRWSRQAVGELFVVQLGKMLNKVAKQKYPQLPYLTNFNVRWGSFNTEELNTMYFSEKDREKFSLKRGDLILCEGGEVGRCAIWNENLSTCYYQKALHRLRPKADILPRYFQAYMESIAGTKLLEDYTSRTSIAHLTREKLLKLPVLLPPLPEQKKIAQILSTWDKAIETVEKLIGNSQQKKKALMQQLLTGKKRFSSFDGEWSEVRLEKIAKIVMGSSPSSKAYNDNAVGLPLIQGNADIKKRKSAPRVFTTEITKECNVGDILLSVRAPVGEVSISIHHACIGRGIASIKSNNPQQHGFLYQWLLWHEPRWASLSQGSTFSAVNSNGISNMPLRLPSNIEEQQKIASVLSSADQEIEIWQQELTHLKQEKKALMQQLLTGKRRVKVDEDLS